MLKIEVIKFEAQDVITSSVACICSDDTWYHHGSYYEDGVANHTNGDVQCPADSHPNCWQPEEIN